MPETKTLAVRIGDLQFGVPDFNRGLLEGFRFALAALHGANGGDHTVEEQLQAATDRVAAVLRKQEAEKLRSVYDELHRQITPEEMREMIEQVRNRTGLEDSVSGEQLISELEELARKQRAASK